MKNSEIAEGAIEVLEKKGWLQGDYHLPGAGYCLMGAGLKVLGFSTMGNQLVGKDMAGFSEALTRLENAFITTAVDLSGASFDITYLNDTVLKTKDEAIEFLTNTTKYWRDRGE